MKGYNIGMRPCLGSANSFDETVITVENRTKVALPFYWLDFAGNEIFYGPVFPNDSVNPRTYVGYVWLVKDHKDAIISVFESQKENGQVIIDIRSDLPAELVKVSADTQSSTPGTRLAKPLDECSEQLTPSSNNYSIELVDLKGYNIGMRPCLGSFSGGIDTGIIIENRTDVVLTYYWLDSEGNEKFYGEIAPNAFVNQHTYVGHVWLVKDHKDAIISVFESQKENGQVIIDVRSDLPAEVVKVSGDTQSGTPGTRLAKPFVVEVKDEEGNPAKGVQVTFRVSAGGGKLSATSITTGANGRAQTFLTLGSRRGINSVRASVTGVDPVTFNTRLDPTIHVATANRLVKVSGDTQNGTPGTRLAKPFVVEVRDEEENPAKGVQVTFRVSAGGGKLSATSITTGANGRAQTFLTLGSKRGINSVQASVAGVDPVTFNTRIDPTIHVAAANRPVMYWIDGGALYHLAGTKAKQIAPSANDVAVDIAGGKIYWTVQTGERAGMINSANLDGTNVETVKETPYNVPLSLAVDSANGKLYWIDSRDRIRSSNLDGTGGQEVLPNLPDPKDIALSSGNAYWTEGMGSIRRVNLTGRKITIEITSGLGTLGGLAVSGNKVYWTEDAGDGTGGIYRADLDGTNVETVKATPYNVPLSLAVDSANGKLYWAESKGRIRSSNLNGGKIRNVVEGLISPSTLAIGGENADDTAVAAAPARVVAAPDENLLLPNYPNPFNPETWIPYQLAESADVTLTIYDINGRVVQHLDLGHQPAGIYQSKARAAYWDGRNAQAEPVASGVYFYTLKAGDFSATKKMLIRK